MRDAAEEIAAMSRTEYLLRRLLATRLSGRMGYFDDGELQDNSRLPAIDYLRDHPKDIELALAQRSIQSQDGLPALISAVSFLLSTTVPQTSQQEQCWPVLQRALDLAKKGTP